MNSKEQHGFYGLLTVFLSLMSQTVVSTWAKAKCMGVMPNLYLVCEKADLQAQNTSKCLVNLRPLSWPNTSLKSEHFRNHLNVLLLDCHIHFFIKHTFIPPGWQRGNVPPLWTLGFDASRAPESGALRTQMAMFTVGKPDGERVSLFSI